MYNQRNRWLTGLSVEEFAALCPWEFINHPESRSQWIAEVRKRLATRLSDNEILSTLYLGLHTTVSKAIARHAGTEPERRGTIIIGSALQYVRQEGIPAVFGEMSNGMPSGTTISLDACLVSPRHNGFDSHYNSVNNDYTESLPTAPQFLADEQAVPDAQEVKVLRLLVVESLDAGDISQVLNVSKRQVWKLHRELRLKLCTLSREAGVSPHLIEKFQATLKKCPSPSPSI
jgi:predicted DNA-binding protein (UPF0251 family)